VFLKPLERLAIFGMDTVPRLNLVPKRQQDAGGTLAIHPGSGSEKKNWPEERWHELLKLIAKGTSWRVLLIGGEAEGERLQRLATIVPIERLAVALNKPLPELAQTLARCAAFLGHDSGITHLAAAVELRGVALWGGTNARIWRPLSHRFTLLQDDQGVAHLEPDRVLGAITEIMK
jgi:ADP-heptose:LPS heptosyltransferase